GRDVAQRARRVGIRDHRSAAENHGRLTMEHPIEISLEFTPNPKTLKYCVNRRFLLVGSEYFVSAEEAEGHSPLAVKLFGMGDISAVMFGADFVTVTLEAPNRLRELNRQIIDTIRAHIEAGETVVTPRDPDER